MFKKILLILTLLTLVALAPLAYTSYQRILEHKVEKEVKRKIEEENNKVTLKDHYKYDLAVTAIFQNEAPYLKEWIEYHKMLGVQHFYLFDNASRDDVVEALKPYLISGLVDLIHEPKVAKGINEWTPLQESTYDKALSLAQGETKWLAILDLDEFLVPLQKDNLIDFLADYEDCPGVVVNWQLFGTSNVKKIPSDKLMIEMLVMKAPPFSEENRFIKSIVRPEYVLEARVHEMKYKKPYKHVNSDKESFFCGGVSQRIAIDKIQINHYWTRDEDFFYTVKLKHRARCESKEDSEARKNSLSQVEDHSMDRFVEPLRKQMGRQVTDH